MLMNNRLINTINIKELVLNSYTIHKGMSINICIYVVGTCQIKITIKRNIIFFM